MRRLCTESSCPYPGRSAPQAVRAARGVGLRPTSKVVESPPNPTTAVVATGAGLRATAKAVEQPPDPTMTPSAPCGNAWRDGAEISRRHSSQTPTVMGGTR
jgi:hypothetical protein